MADVKKFFRPLSFALAPSLSLLALRVIAGAALMHHGSGKIQNPFGWMGADSSMPGILQALAALSEFGGGLALILGLVTPLAAFGIACTMLVATWTHAVVRGDPFVGKGGSYELASVFLGIALVMIFVGPGRFSIDAKLFGERR